MFNVRGVLGFLSLDGDHIHDALNLACDNISDAFGFLELTFSMRTRFGSSREAS